MPAEKQNERPGVEAIISPGVNVGLQVRVPRWPVVFLHGLLGFDRLCGIGYARSWRRVARRLGVQLLTPATITAEAVQLRAQAYDRQLRRMLPQGPCHLVGHSMGGLEARYLVSRLGWHTRVAAVATIGTPHHGCRVLDEWCPAWPRWNGRFNLAAALHDQRPAVASTFNQQVPDSPGIHYFSWAGRIRWWQTHAWFWRFAHRLEQLDGPSDGLVAERSARWGHYMGPVPLNHMGLIGWQLLPLCITRWEDALCRWVYDTLAGVEGLDAAHSTQ